MKITKKNWPRMLLLVGYIAAFAFLVTLPIASPSLGWLFKSLFVIGAGGLIVSTAVLAWRRIIRVVAWVNKSETTNQKIKRAIVAGIGIAIGAFVAVKFWFLPLIFSFSFLGVAIQNVPSVHI